MFGFLFGSKAKKMDATEFKANYKPKTDVLFDVRTAAEFQGGHLENAINLDWLGGTFQAKAAELDKTKTYYLYCASGNRSGQAAKMLMDLGFENVYNVGGYGSLRNL